MGNNRKLQNYLLFGVFLLVILCIASVIYIWFFDKSNLTDSNVTTYTLTDFKAKTYDIYSTEVKRLLLPQNTQQLFDKMQSSFLTENKLNKDNFKDYLERNNLISDEIILTGYSVVDKDDIYVYRINYSVYTDGVLVANKIVNVIESKPYSYTLSFDQESVSFLKNLSLVKEYDDIKFNISCIQSNTDSIKFKIIITNNNEKNVVVDFDNVTNVVLILEDNTFVKMAASVVSSDDEILTNGSTITKEAYFAIGLENQAKIKSINFGSVKIGDEDEVITLDF